MRFSATIHRVPRRHLLSAARYVVLALLIYMPLFGNLNILPIREWDEARNAMNAYEMYRDGDWLVTRLDGEPDMWNTKPPLLTWCQATLMHLIGVNEIAVRLPSSLSALFTCIALVLVCRRYLRNDWPGIISALVLITTDGYIDFHVTRTGDFDAMLTLFTTVSALYFFAYCETGKNSYIRYFFIALAGGVLTKSVAGLLFVPGLLLYAMYRKKLALLIKSRSTYVSFLFFLLPVIGFYLLREWKNPGYIRAVWDNELGGRYLVVQGVKRQSFWFFLNYLVGMQLGFWLLAVPLGMLAGFLSSNEKIKRITVFSVVLVVTHLLVISSAKTALKWYDAPLFPWLALLSGIFVYHIYSFTRTAPINETLRFNFIPVAGLFFIFMTPYKQTWDRIYTPVETEWEKEIYPASYYMKLAMKGYTSMDGKYLLYDGYRTPFDFYLNILRNKGINTGLKRSYEIRIGEVYLAWEKPVIQEIETSYTYKRDNIFKSIMSYTITGVKSDDEPKRAGI